MSSGRIPPPHVPGERRCAKCETVKRGVYMSFMLRQQWHCSFLESDLKTALPRKVSLDEPKKLLEMAKRGGCKFDLEVEHAIHGIEIGRGGRLVGTLAGGIREITAIRTKPTAVESPDAEAKSQRSDIG